MQHGSLIKNIRKHGPGVWQFRWSEKGPQGKRIYRKRVIGSVGDYSDVDAARRAAAGLLRKINSGETRWGDIDFAQGSMNVTRSIVYGVVGPCKTESSQKPVPFHPLLADALSRWREQCAYTKPDDWVFARRKP
jgi:hypothetical protein